MSKTFEKSWGQTVTALFRLFVAWGTDWLHKYRTDFLFRSQYNAIAVYLVFLVVLVILLFAVLYVTQESIISTITANIAARITTGVSSNANPNSMTTDLQTVQRTIFMQFSVAVVLFFLLFGYVLARIILIPVRRVLETQKRFMRDVAHELRTPLAILGMNSDLDLMDEPLSPAVTAAFNSSTEEVNRMSGIINNMLTLDSFFHSDPITFESVDLLQVTARAAQQVSMLARAYNTIVQHESHVAGAVMHGNKTALEQMVTNLLKNAIVYSRRNSTVEVSVHEYSDTYLALVVRDSGSGIAPEHVQKIFEPFFRADESRSRHNSGSGIGLTIVREIVKLHKGNIAVDSTLGVGTTMTVYLPRKIKKSLLAMPYLKNKARQVPRF